MRYSSRATWNRNGRVVRRDRRTHPDGRRSRSSARSSALALFAQLPECLLAIDRFHPTALEIVVPAVERLTDCGYFFEVPGKGILDDVLWGTSTGRGEILQFLGRFGRDVHFHAATVRLRRLTGKYSPLNYLTLIGSMDVARRLCGTVVVPRQVIAELILRSQVGRN